MLKWAVAKDEHRINSTKAVRKRRLGGCHNISSNLSTPSTSEVELCGEYKPRSHFLSQSHRSGTHVGGPFNRKCSKSNFKFGAKVKNAIIEQVNSNICDSLSQGQNQNADSKSLLYMSLDQLPLAIVKQYERMLQDSSTSLTNKCSDRKVSSLPNSPVKKEVKVKSFSPISLENRVAFNKNGESFKNSVPKSTGIPSALKKPSSKLKTGQNVCHQAKKVTIVTHSGNRSANATNNHSNSNDTSSYNQVNSSSSSVIREAKNRTLKVHSATQLNRKVNGNYGTVNKSRKSTGSFPQGSKNDILARNVEGNTLSVTGNEGKKRGVKKENVVDRKGWERNSSKGKTKGDSSCSAQDKRCNETEHEVKKAKVKPAMKSPLIEQNNNVVIVKADEVPRPILTSVCLEDDTNCINNNNKVNKNCSREMICETRKLCDNEMKEKALGYTLYSSRHDTTDPQFLEKSITFSSPRVTRCARKLTLKRSELRKLERIKNQTEKLNRLLKKYYEECLPNLPEEDEDSCSPEQKSISMSVLRKHWTEKCPDRDSSFTSSSSASSASSSSSKGTVSRTRSVKLSLKELEELRNIKNCYSIYENDGFHLLPVIQEDSSEPSSTSDYTNCVMSTCPEIGRRAVKLDEDNSFYMNTSIVESFVKNASIIMHDDDEPDGHIHNGNDHQSHHAVINNNSLLMSKHDNNTHVLTFSYLTEEEDEEEEDYDNETNEEKLKGSLADETLEKSFDVPTLEDEGFMSPYPLEGSSSSPSSSTCSITNRLSISSSCGSKYDDNYKKFDTNSDTMSSSPSSSIPCSPQRCPGSKSCLAEHDDSSDVHNETWNSHTHSTSRIIQIGPPLNNNNNFEEGMSPESSYIDAFSKDLKPAAVSDHCSSTKRVPADNDYNSQNHVKWLPAQDDEYDNLSISLAAANHDNKNENRDDQLFEESSFAQQSFVSSNKFPLGSSTTSKSKSKSVMCVSTVTQKKFTTPRKIIKKPPVKTTFSGKGEVLIRTYRNGNYVTVHVLQAKKLQPCYFSSWRLSMKVSLLPDESEETLTRSDSLLVPKNKKSVKIDHKFSFEVTQSEKKRKIFLTFIKRLERKSFFLGWATLDLIQRSKAHSNEEQETKNWLKLRRRKMNPSPSTSSSHHSCISSGNGANHRSSSSSGNTSNQIETLEEISDSRSDNSSGNGRKSNSSGLHNSSTMDSGVEDCCEPIVHSIELDEKIGKRVTVKMSKPDNMGFGFSVVWVSPPRIERLEKGKIADQAGLRIGDLIIGVNGEDVTTVPNTTIYHKMKTTGNEVELELWRKHESTSSSVASSSTSHSTHTKKSASSNANCRNNMNTTMTTTSLKNETLASSSNSSSSTNSNVNNHRNDYENTKRRGSRAEAHPQLPTSSSSIAADVSNANVNMNSSCGASVTNLETKVVSCANPSVSKNHNGSNYSSSSSSIANSNRRSSLTAPKSPPLCKPGKPVTTASMPSSSSSSSSSSSTSHSNSSNSNILKSDRPHSTQEPSAVSKSSHANTVSPPVSILKPSTSSVNGAGNNINVNSNGTNKASNQTNCEKGDKTSSSNGNAPTQSSWKIRFNVELLNNEDDSLKQFFICELKFFRKVVAALDRYLIPAQASLLLTPQEIHMIFSHVIRIITMTKRILQCVANGASSSTWKLGAILLSTHSDHLPEIILEYTGYTKGLCQSATILSEKMTLQAFAKFVLETPVPKGHLDMTSLLFAPFEHLRNLCEISEEISHHFENWTKFATHLKECYSDIVCQTDFMEPISHISMKKNPLLSARDLERRIVSTNFQHAISVSEKGRKWLFGSRLYRQKNDGSWSPVWAFLFTDIIVLTSHTTRDRVFFVKEPPIRLEDIATVHFNLNKKHEAEFRLVMGTEVPQHQNKLDKILPLHRHKKQNQIVLRTPSVQLKNVWKLLLQRQIITINTRMAKSSSSNFSISEFCEKFPENEEAKVLDDPEENQSSSNFDNNNKDGANNRADDNDRLSKTNRTKSEYSSINKQIPPEKFKDSQQIDAANNNKKPGSENSMSSVPPCPQRNTSPINIFGCSKASLINNNINSEDTTNGDGNYYDCCMKKDRPKNSIEKFQLEEKENSNNGAALKNVNNMINGSSNDSRNRESKQKKSNEENVPASSIEETATIFNPKGLIHASDLVVLEESKGPSNSGEKFFPVHCKENLENNNITENNNDSNYEKYDGSTIQTENKYCSCNSSSSNSSVVSMKSYGKNLQKDVLTRSMKSAGNNAVMTQTFLPLQPAQLSCLEKSSQTDLAGEAYSSNERINGSPLFQYRSYRTASKIMTNASLKPRQHEQLANPVTGGPRPRTSNTNFPKSINDHKMGDQHDLKECLVSRSANDNVAAKVEDNTTNPSQMAPAEHNRNEILKKAAEITVKGIERNSKDSAMQSVRKITDLMDSPLMAVRSRSANVTPNKSNPQRSKANLPVLPRGCESEKPRRKFMYDNNIQKDYPELFGITPKDRRSFIKKIGEKDIASEKTLIAPYYYSTGSPLPIPRMLTKLAEKYNSSMKKPVLDRRLSEDNASEVSSKFSGVKNSSNTEQYNVERSNMNSYKAAKDSINATGNSRENNTNDNSGDGEAYLKRDELFKIVHQPTAHDNVGGENSDEISVLQEFPSQIHYRRSPEESSNDSGISDEIMEKNRLQGEETTISSSASTALGHRMRDTNRDSEVTSTKNYCMLSKCVTPSSCSKKPVCSIPPIKTQCKFTETESFLEGSSSTTMETVVVLKSDKGTEIDEHLLGYENHSDSNGSTSTIYFNGEENRENSSLSKLRISLAQKREAFFLNRNKLITNPQDKINCPYSNNISIHTSFMPSSLCSPTDTNNSSNNTDSPVCTVRSPLKVRIVEGESLKSLDQFGYQRLKREPSYERVMYTRLEKERTAKFERVASDDSTSSSDIASASTALENGTTDPSWSSSTSSLAGYSTSKDDTMTALSASTATSKTTHTCHSSMAHQSSYEKAMNNQVVLQPVSYQYEKFQKQNSFACSSDSGTTSIVQPEIVVTQGTPPLPGTSEEELNDSLEDSQLQKACNEDEVTDDENGNDHEEPCCSSSSGRTSFLRVESNDSNIENYGDEEDYDLGDDEEEDDLSHCSVATINRYGTFESLEKLDDEEQGPNRQSDMSRSMHRSKARFTFDDDEDVEEDLFEDDIESDFNFRFPYQIQDNTYSVSRLGPLPPLLEEDVEDEMYDEQRANSTSPGYSVAPGTSANVNGNVLRSRHEASMRGDNSFLLARLATMYARSSISPLRIIRELWLKKRYRQWAYRE